MSDIAGSIWWLIVALGVLVTFHEFGHYWVARRCGVGVLRFSVGFGKPLWSRRDRHGTEFAIAPIPLGGYVKMLDEREADVPAERLHEAFNRKPVGQRIAVVAAGPIANLILCVALLWLMFVIGKEDFAPVVGQVAGIAQQSGLRPGDRILDVDGRSTPTATEATIELTGAAMDGRDARARVEDAAGNTLERTVHTSRVPAGFDEQDVAGTLGLRWQFLVDPAEVRTVAADSPAAGVLQVGDLITAIDGEPVQDASELRPKVQALGARGGEVMVEVEREGSRLALPLRPRQMTDPASGAHYWGLGISLGRGTAPAYDALQRYGPLQAIPVALRQTGQLASDSLGMIRRMLTGHASLQGVSGPITIAKVANASAERGLTWFLQFLALLSLSLAIVNLLPIPVLDGGHLLYYLIELVKGSPLSERAMAAGQFVGLAFLAGLMGLALYNDILRPVI
ncbi:MULTISPECIES: RIP metalloprotease RseP [Pseudoxanthomonas]|jgi:regulator of sigma E protease|uniref:Zinc metalloprotease n=1 Tax=Pseudoxanthomonas winnipegensis TaxID=2480810 RepID=A0A4Q8L5U5_9GAMM|nr:MULTISPECIES: RIP metalloprotease RseP [Pseudoxanthomonas]PZP63338.1 MAG: RIP metalloprotease RseP [Pseudoxanthomonas spadix]TAA21660.1 RIP metalloprotease RseP [Pseudoxanthomonas winnipegensis]TMN25564.1 RIP metalloprotease RseP [Pseudoxanthomonas sp. X-1]UAY76233.1 RIP metalloprotease RseP [Pseudoxanthomonas sp. X-1]